MKKGMKILIIVIVAILVITLPLISNYNSLVTLNQSADNSYADIDTQLQRRSDLIPNLVSTVKGYAIQEKDVFTDIADARAKLAGAGNVSDKANADSELSGSLSRLLVVVEAYPDLKSNQNFRDLSIQLEGTENRISIAREDYNASVTEYNTKRRKFPSNLTASMFGFEEKDLYKASEGAKELPTVDFTTKNE
ncbi:LemA family protein [Clostridium vincentii]|uniref:LemA family protein n=1 Tax=Clostridium vincentii TaxID=52704 RepID=A0A2T0BEK8_9CLOT|nr:LemA family protein [Clostridium vincentii]PRR82263.1 LemA family protein [Clostridium vincentii]